jgi:hypothetical protein
MADHFYNSLKTYDGENLNFLLLKLLRKSDIKQKFDQVELMNE